MKKKKKCRRVRDIVVVGLGKGGEMAGAEKQGKDNPWWGPSSLALISRAVALHIETGVASRRALPPPKGQSSYCARRIHYPASLSLSLSCYPAIRTALLFPQGPHCPTTPWSLHCRHVLPRLDDLAELPVSRSSMGRRGNCCPRGPPCFGDLLGRAGSVSRGGLRAFRRSLFSYLFFFPSLFSSLFFFSFLFFVSFCFCTFGESLGGNKAKRSEEQGRHHRCK